jgi:hypothetical protein
VTERLPRSRARLPQSPVWYPLRGHERPLDGVRAAERLRGLQRLVGEVGASGSETLTIGRVTFATARRSTSNDLIRHGTKIVCLRDDEDPRDCRFGQRSQ